MDLTLALGLSGVPVVTGLTEVVKRAFPAVPARMVPLVSLAIALALNLGFGHALEVPFATAAGMGLVAGLAASGLYSAGREWRT